MTKLHKNVKVINLDDVLVNVSNHLFNDEYIFNNTYKLDKSIHYKKRLFIKQLIQHYFLIELLDIIKNQNSCYKTILLIQPCPNPSIPFLTDPTGEIAYTVIKKLVKKVQSLLPLYFCFLDENISLNNIYYAKDLNNQKDLYYLLLELVNNNKKYNIKKIKAFLSKNGFTAILRDYFGNINNILITNGH